jgi:uncharacterized membrane protein
MIGTVFVRPLRAHPRLAIAVAISLIAALLLPAEWRRTTRAIVSLDAGGVVFLVLSWIMMANSTADRMRERAAMQDDGRVVVLLLTAGAALFSLATVAIELHGLKEMNLSASLDHIGLVAGTIVCAWLATHTMFAVHYAHCYYSDADPAIDKQADVGGLEFPGCPQPDYWDFLYFSFVIGMTCQTSDVAISGRRLRRQALGHGVLSFFFNTVILALSINIAAGLL